MTIQNAVGRVFYPQPIGNAFSQSTMLVDAVGEKGGGVFIVPKTGNIAKVHYRIQTLSVSAALDVRLETVSTATGNPTGTLWGTNTNVSDTPVASGWRVATLTANAAVTKGDILALVIVQSTGNMVLNHVNNSALQYPYAVQFTTAWSRLTAWGFSGAIEYDDGTFADTPGLIPFATSAAGSAYSSASSPNVRGMRFSLPFPARMRGAWFAFSAASASASITFKLYDSDGATVLRTLVHDTDLSVSAVSSGTRFIEWATTVDLAANTFYRVVVVPDTNAVTLIENTVNSAGLLDAWGLGQNGHLTTATSPTVEASWTQTTTSVPMCGLILSGFDGGSAGGGLITHPGMAGGMRG